jgi:hypothetical protein
MAFLVEDGTGLADANSYASVAFADAYFTLRGITAWAGTNDQKESWLVQATDYIDYRFGRRIAGERLTTTQALIFPIDLYDGMPTNLLKATSEYALRAISGPLAPDLTFNSSGTTVTETFRKVGPIETKTKFASSGAGSVPMKFRPYPAADALMAEFFIIGDQVIRN